MTIPECKTQDEELFENCSRRSDYGIKLSNKIKKAARIEGDRFAYIHALRIYLCSSKKNIWIAEETEKSGIVQEAGFSGRLFRCRSVICPECSRKTICRNRRRALNAVTGTIVPENQNWRLITMTMPHIKADYNKTLKIFSRTWDLFRKLKFFVKNVTGGIKSIESKPSKTGTSHHIHLHLLAVTKFIEEKKFKELWKRCLKKALNENGLKYHENVLKDQLPIINIQLIKNKRGLSLYRQLQKICIYIIKSLETRNISNKCLLQIAGAKRWKRMFDLFGCCRIGAKNTSVSNTYDYLDNDPTFDVKSKNKRKHNKLPVSTPVKICRTEYTESIDFLKYIKILKQQVYQIRSKRKKLLRGTYSKIKFYDLYGNRW
jgi:hypothetical protein